MSSSTKVVKIARKNGQVVQGWFYVTAGRNIKFYKCVAFIKLVYIGRACYMGGWKLSKSKWANPFSVRECGSAEKAVEKFEEYLLSNEELVKDVGELKGKTLGWFHTVKFIKCVAFNKLV